MRHNEADRIMTKEGQETIILLASPRMRRGPGSPMARLVRQFETYWLNCTPHPIIYVVEDTHLITDPEFATKILFQPNS